MSTLVLGAMAAALAAWLMWRSKATKLSVWLGFIAGLTVGVGLLGNIAHRVAAALASAGSRGSALLFGVAVPAVIGIVVLAELWHAGHPRKGRPHRIAHPILAFLAPVLLLAAGGIFATLVGWAHQGVDTVPSVTASLLGGG